MLDTYIRLVLGLNAGLYIVGSILYAIAGDYRFSIVSVMYGIAAFVLFVWR